MSFENQIEPIRRLCRALSLGEAPEWRLISDPETLALAHRHKLLDFAAPAELEPEIGDELLVRRQGQRAMLRRAALVVSAFEKARMGYAICKGPAQSLHLYGASCQRTYYDLDILVEAHRTGEVHALLGELGYVQHVLHELRPGSGPEVPICALPKADFRLQSNYVSHAPDAPEIEIHCRLPDGNEEILPFLIGAEAFSDAAFAARGLDLPHQFAFLLLDKAKDLRDLRGLVLRDIVELALSARKVRASPTAMRKFAELWTHRSNRGELADLMGFVDRVLGVSAMGPLAMDLAPPEVDDPIAAPSFEDIVLLRAPQGAAIRKRYRHMRAAETISRVRGPLASRLDETLALTFGGSLRLGIEPEDHAWRFWIEIELAVLNYFGWLAAEFRLLQGREEASEIAYRLTWADGEISVRVARDFESGGQGEFADGGPEPHLDRGDETLRLSFALPDEELPRLQAHGAEVLFGSVNVRRRIYRSRLWPDDLKIAKVAAQDFVLTLKRAGPRPPGSGEREGCLPEVIDDATMDAARADSMGRTLSRCVS